jgi:hypothetical protein
MGCRLDRYKLVVLVNGVELRPRRSQEVYNHSPDGFEWGYGGSGPSQLALAILLNELDSPVDALNLYQEFKDTFVAGWPRQIGTGWVLTSADIAEWVCLHETSLRRGPPPPAV